jgi:alpha-beta hydrolase superfamily lysophospholipase
MPVPANLAKKLGANVFYTRLKGHGRISIDSMGESSTKDWLRDGVEALEIGKRLGEHVILMGNSTGSTLLVWLAMQKKLKDDIFSLVLLSPNFFPKDSTSKIILWPWGQQIAKLVMGEYREWKPANEGVRKNWSWKTPTKAVFTMMGLVDLVNKMDLRNLKIPLLILHSNFDKTISVPKIKERYLEIGSKIKKRVEVNNTEAKGGHILAGDILSPSTNKIVVDHIYKFLSLIMK